MQKNKIPLGIITGGMAIAGLVAGMATMASAQTSTVAPKAPAVTTSVSAAAVSPIVDTPESANDPVDSSTVVDTPESASDPVDAPDSVDVAGQGQVGEQDTANDTDGGAASETAEVSSGTGGGE